MEADIYKDIHHQQKNKNLFFIFSGAAHINKILQVLHMEFQPNELKINTAHLNMTQFFNTALDQLRTKKEINLFLTSYASMFLSTISSDRTENILRSERHRSKGNDLIDKFKLLNLDFLEPGYDKPVENVKKIKCDYKFPYRKTTKYLEFDNTKNILFFEKFCFLDKPEILLEKIKGEMRDKQLQYLRNI
ncbi:hypothetical protein BpHYR1_021313 [Brachionus plicatilis]|uniref:Uncharacterized protein n=1 Tax=Brachionus plicatilis TaxID=10195 RepID=A0A3M7P6H8_BRAPC|nr:hypothetical protein BpHYR1_021313 [Brachionus plicatilis]